MKQFKHRSSGGVYPAITQDELQKVLIPLPSKKIQCQIVALMDHAYAIKREKEMEAADKAKQEVDNILFKT